MLSNKTACLFLIFTVGLSTGITACQAGPHSEPSLCAQTDASVQCLLEYADTTLKATEDSFSWASSAAELATAYDAAGKTQHAEQLISDAIKRSQDIEDVKQRGTVLGEILTAIAALSKTDKAAAWGDSIQDMMLTLEPRAKADISGKLLVLNAVHGDTKAAYSDALNLPQEDDVDGYTKAISLRKMANILAKKGDLKTSREAVDSITMSIDYYKSMVRSDVARQAYKNSDKQLAKTLLQEADPIARSLDNGYFSGAALRDIAYSYHTMGLKNEAQDYFAQALEETTRADKQNEKARATSRLATRLSDAGLGEQTESILRQAAEFANGIESEAMKSYSWYEIAGSAGISGQFELARTWLNNVPDTPMGSTSSLRSAAERDLAWGLARSGMAEEALAVAQTIKAPREKIHALSRMIRVIENPDMEALPRYL